MKTIIGLVVSIFVFLLIMDNCTGSCSPAELDARKVYKAARDAMQVLCQARYELFGAAGHASKIKAIPLSEMAKRY